MRQQLYKIFSRILETFNYFSRTIRILASSGKIYIVAIICFAVIFGVMPSVSILVMQTIINALQAGDNDLNYIIMLVLIYIGLDALSGIAGHISAYVENILQMKASITLNMSILDKTKELTLRDFENSETYNLIQRAVSTNISQVFTFFKSFVLAFQSIITLIAFSIILASWRWWILPVIFIIPLVNMFVTALFGKKQFLIHRNRAGKSRKQWYFQYLLTNDIAFKEIKTFGLGNYFRSKYKQLSVEFLNQDRRLLNQKTGTHSGLLVIDQIISAFLFLYVIIQTFIGALLLGDLITYTRSISNIKLSVQGFLSQMNSIYQTTLYIRQYFEFIDMNTEPEETGTPLPTEGVSFIEIKNLSYRYKNKSDYALKNLNLKIEKGNLIAFIGQNGSGKSTLVKILSALYTDYQGNIYIGKTNLREISPNDIREKIGLLFQDYVKYELTARENIAMGQLNKINDDLSISNAIKKTGMQDRVIDLETQLGSWFDDGVQLSGGEWLRVALSRAFIRDAEIYLLDEPNSALDSVSERHILNSFKELTNGKIGIIVSHRIASIKNVVDKIIVFDSGSIQACGTHDELLNTSKVYRELYEQEEGAK